MLLVRSVIIVLLGLCASCSGQDVEDYYSKDQSVVSARKNQDVAILKQIHRHNEDGSYTYGYEGADGSFKIETKTTSGEVTGKYGYVDDSGKLRVVEYGANKHGFQPSGTGITVPPPTLVESRPEENVDDDDDDVDELERPQPARRPTKPQRPLFQRNNDENVGGFVQQQQQQQQPIPNAVRSPPVTSFDDGDWSSAGRADDQSSWSSQTPSRPRAPAPLYRPAPAGRFGLNAAAAAARPKSVPPPPPPVSGSFDLAAEAPSGSYQSVQDFGAGGSRRGDDFSSGRGRAAEQRQSSYQTYEDHKDEPATDEPQPLYRPSVKPARRSGGGGDGSAARTFAVPAARAVPRQMRTGSILDQLAEQYALPQSGSPVSHSVSFGLDQ